MTIEKQIPIVGEVLPVSRKDFSCSERYLVVVLMCVRQSTIRHADIILVVHDGKIVESGSHRELMAAKGAYWQLYTRQYREEQTRTIMESDEQ